MNALVSSIFSAQCSGMMRKEKYPNCIKRLRYDKDREFDTTQLVEKDSLIWLLRGRYRRELCTPMSQETKPKLEFLEETCERVLSKNGEVTVNADGIGICADVNPVEVGKTLKVLTFISNPESLTVPKELDTAIHLSIPRLNFGISNYDNPSEFSMTVCYHYWPKKIFEP